MAEPRQSSSGKPPSRRSAAPRSTGKRAPDAGPVEAKVAPKRTAAKRSKAALVRPMLVGWSAYDSLLRKKRGPAIEDVPVAPSLPDGWPPVGWESGVCPSDDSREAMRQWFEHLIGADGTLRHYERSFQCSMPAACSTEVRDAWRLVDHLRAKRVARLPDEAQMDPHGTMGAIALLTRLRDRLVGVARQSRKTPPVLPR